MVIQSYSSYKDKLSSEFLNPKLRRLLCNSRTSRPEVFCKKGVLENLIKITGKHLCQSLFFNKVAGLRPPVNFVKLLRTPFCIEHLRWLLLLLVNSATL